MTARWWAENGEAWVADLDGVILWHGTVAGPKVLDAFTLSGTDDGVIVLDWMVRPRDVLPHHPYPNLLVVHPSGEIVWRAELPPGEKSWTGATMRNGQLIGFGWQSSSDLDPATGEITSSQFTK